MVFDAAVEEKSAAVEGVYVMRIVVDGLGCDVENAEGGEDSGVVESDENVKCNGNTMVVVCQIFCNVFGDIYDDRMETARLNPWQQGAPKRVQQLGGLC